MKKIYEAPSITGTDDLSFETVCTASGTVACPYSKSAPDPYNADNLCTQCLQTNCKEAYNLEAPKHYSSPNWAADTSAALISQGYCPSGYAG